MKLRSLRDVKPRAKPNVEALLAKASRPTKDSMRLHPYYRGKIQMAPKCPVRSLDDFAIWYTPGVAAPCRAIEREPESVYELTNKGNVIAIVTDGTRVLGLGDIGPEAALPVMEGKALLFKYLGGVDAIPICLGTKDPEEIIRTVEILQPGFGAVNLEDISQPKCFRILDRLRDRMTIPVWHDDQQGSATVLLAGLRNALRIVGKDIGGIKTAMIGMGAANVATYRILRASGLSPDGVVACDTTGTLHRKRRDLEEKQEEFPDKWRVCRETNADGVAGGIPEALEGADVCIAFSRSGPGVIRPEWVRTMAKDPIVFACANPVPEIWPWEAREAGARIVATGRSDFPNQLNNSLGFPGIFRGVLDVRARTITDEMAMAAASELARSAEERGIDEENILPHMDEWEIYPRVAVATAMKARDQGIARKPGDAAELHREATRIIRGAREQMQVMMKEGLIRAAPAKSGAPTH
jgi:malate dehydrogenase (oxaloacetate-decarboxylating)